MKLWVVVRDDIYSTKLIQSAKCLERPLWIAMEDKWGHLVSAAPEVSGNNETITAMILPSRWKKVRKQLDV